MKPEPAIAALIAAFTLAGCAGGNFGLRAGDAPSARGAAPAPGASTSTAAIRAELSPNAYFGVVFLGAVMLGLDDLDPRPGYGAASRRPPPLAEGRAIAERDCSQALGPLSENLRCN